MDLIQQYKSDSESSEEPSKLSVKKPENMQEVIQNSGTNIEQIDSILGVDQNIVAIKKR